MVIACYCTNIIIYVCFNKIILCKYNNIYNLKIFTLVLLEYASLPLDHYSFCLVKKLKLSFFFKKKLHLAQKTPSMNEEDKKERNVFSPSGQVCQQTLQYCTL